MKKTESFSNNKNNQKRVNSKLILIVGLALILFGAILIIGVGPNKDNGLDVYENIDIPEGQEAKVEGLLKVKKDANHPCAGGFEVKDKLDIDGKKLCTTSNEQLEAEALPQEKTKKLQDEVKNMTSTKSEDFIEALKSTGQPPVDPEIAREFQEVESASASLAAYGASPLEPTQPRCYGDGKDGKRIVLVAAGTKEHPITEEEKALIQNIAGQMESTLIWGSYRQNPDKVMRWRFYQGQDCKPEVIVAEQSADYFNELSVFTFAALKQDWGLINATRQAKGNNLIPHYLVFTRSGGGACGQSDFALGGGLENSVSYSFVYGKTTYYPNSISECWNGFNAQHEIMHAKGAVDFTAPNTTLFGHCYDENDIMCYNDTGNVNLQYRCVTGEDYYLLQFIMDCNAEDYFSVKPDANTVFNPNWFLGQQGFARYNTAKSGFMTNNPGSDKLTDPVSSIDSTAPVGPQQLIINSTAGNQVSLSWATATDNIGVAKYELVRNGAVIYSGSQLSYTDNSVTTSTNYQYVVYAYDAAGNKSQGATASTTTPPSVPTGSEGGNTGSTDNEKPSTPTKISKSLVADWSTVRYNLRLNWQASVDNVGVTQYTVKRNDKLLGTTKSTTFDDKTFSPGYTLKYSIQAQDAAGNTSESASTTATAYCLLIWCSLQ